MRDIGLLSPSPVPGGPVARTALFDLFRQPTRVALASECVGAPSREATQVMRLDRRSVLKGLTAVGAGLAAMPARALELEAQAKPPPPSVRVGIVGAGMAGLACAYDLKRAGINATL